MSNVDKLPAFLLVAHGSRRQASNEEIKALTEKLSKRLNRHFSFISYAFLELAKPSIPDGVEACAASGADKVFILPYFLSEGVHVAKDIPTQIKEKKRQYPHIKIDIGDYFGRSEKVVAALLDIALGYE